MSYENIDSLIIKRLQFLFKTTNPLFYRNEFLKASWKRGCSLEDDQLEDKWIQMVIHVFSDNVLKELVAVRNLGYFAEDTYDFYNELSKKVS